MLLKFLHPFGHRAEAEVPGQRQDRPNQSGWLWAVGDIDHEGAVDLERVDRNLVEQAERRIPCAKVVEGDSHSDSSELRQNTNRQLGVLHDGTLGNLECQAL